MLASIALAFDNCDICTDYFGTYLFFNALAIQYFFDIYA